MKHPTMNHFGWIAAACVALAAWNVAQAQPLLNGQRTAGQNAQGGPAARAAGSINGSALDAAGSRRLVGDGQGNVAAGSSGAYTTDSGAQGARSTRFKRNDDGSASAKRQGNLTTANGSTAARDASYTRNADGSASAERSTSATNANTGVTYDGSATWTKGEGISRSGSCKDASGKTVTCGSQR
jgi:hypothetical protein